MRLVQKLTVAFILTTSAILAVGGALRAQREVAFLEFDRVRDHRLIGHALGAAITAIWRTDGEKRALAVLEHENQPNGRVHMRWVWLEGRPADVEPAFERQAIEATPVGDVITRTVTVTSGDRVRYTYVPLGVDPKRHGAIEISESLVAQQRFAHRVVMDTLVTTVTLALVSAGLSTLLGIWIVGRPMQALAGKARRVGQGDFTGPLVLPQKDELADLAREMNTMCERLIAAHDRVEEATAKKLSAEAQLRHADRLNTVGKLASGIAHELGTPLNVVSARAQMIAARETNADETVDYANVIVQATERMTRIIRQLLEFARRKESDKTTCALEPLARRTLEMLGPLAGKRGVMLVMSDEKERPTLVDCDAGALEQVFTNLVMNAVQAMDEPGEVRVAIAEERREPPPFAPGPEITYATVRVTDHGSGIKEEDIPHVFEPFFTTKDVGEGTGLGLLVAYGIVRDHGGWIVVESSLGEGSAFIVYLPAKVVASA
jgi:two-component system, NtrC family, sensor kinase